MSVVIQQCDGCGRHYFPARALCEQCGSKVFNERTVGDGVIEEVTAVASGHRLATVRLVDEVAVIATLTGANTVTGARVPVHSVATVDDENFAYIPGATSASDAQERDEK